MPDIWSVYMRRLSNSRASHLRRRLTVGRRNRPLTIRVRTIEDDGTTGSHVVLRVQVHSYTTALVGSDGSELYYTDWLAREYKTGRILQLDTTQLPAACAVTDDYDLANDIINHPTNNELTQALIYV